MSRLPAGDLYLPGKPRRSPGSRQNPQPFHLRGRKVKLDEESVGGQETPAQPAVPRPGGVDRVLCKCDSGGISVGRRITVHLTQPELRQDITRTAAPAGRQSRSSLIPASLDTGPGKQA